jgi:thiol-disulfide isomerase/thioredoxin
MSSRQIQLFLVALALLVTFAWYQYRKPRFVAGEVVPPFTATLLNGQTIAFDEFKGKYVLIQFWGSWCGPCRAENPLLVELYNKYHNRGFEIFSIGVEQNAQAWQRAIARDGLTWPYHTADMKRFDGELAKMFNIHSIPSTFLVDPMGWIIRVNPDPSEIDRILSEKL